MKSDFLYSEKWTRPVVLILRLAVGVVFAFSGFVKAIDPWGMFYKLEDYTAALGMDWLAPFLTFGAFSIPMLEFVLGVSLIIGAYRRFSAWAALLVMLMMTPLTLWLLVTGAVPDCGCFGEALVLSNVATFIKNAILLLATCYLVRYNVRVANFYSPSIQWIVTVITTLFIGIVASYGYFCQPMMDFRPFKVGQPIISSGVDEEMDDACVFIYEKDGVQHEFSLDEVPAEDDTTWVFVDRREVKTVDSETLQFSLSQGDENVTDSVLRQKGEQILLLFPDMKEIDISYTYLINVMDDFARTKGVDMIGATAADAKAVEEWNDLSMATYPIYKVDDTQLKMLARGNPAVVYLRDGVVKWKRTLQSISAVRVDEAMQGGGDFEWIGADYDGEGRLKSLSALYVSLMILIIVLNRSYRVYKFSARILKKNRK